MKLTYFGQDLLIWKETPEITYTLLLTSHVEKPLKQLAVSNTCMCFIDIAYWWQGNAELCAYFM